MGYKAMWAKLVASMDRNWWGMGWPQTIWCSHWEDDVKLPPGIYRLVWR